MNQQQPHPPQQPPGWGQPPQQPVWGAPPPQPPKKPMSAGVIAVLITAALGVLIVAASLSDDDSEKQPTAKASSSPAAAAKPTDKPANPKKLDDAASLACEDFARGYKAAQTQQARIDLADKVNKWAQKSSTDGIADNAIVLARGSEGSAGAWQIGADTFAQTCLDAGWDG